jgi:hypothetical protein
MDAVSPELMIFPQSNVAKLIAERLTKVKGTKHDVLKIPQGFQVVPITVCPAYMPPAKPKPVVTHGNDLWAIKDGEAIFTLPLVGVGQTYITVKHNGKSVAFGKSTLLGWQQNTEHMTIDLKMTIAVAKKRGLLIEG